MPVRSAFWCMGEACRSRTCFNADHFIFSGTGFPFFYVNFFLVFVRYVTNFNISYLQKKASFSCSRLGTGFPKIIPNITAPAILHDAEMCSFQGDHEALSAHLLLMPLFPSAFCLSWLLPVLFLISLSVAP